ncbi:DUF84 family protein [Candidatus Saganbacteria bacterium]|nr:DUF84 family protein [Candidatus Saganbacteria bacterium]
MRVLKIGVTSENKLKTEAVRKAYASAGVSAQVTGYKTDSKVGEQPVDDQTIAGARNRIADLITRNEGLDRIVSIESGIFKKDEGWEDIGVAVIVDPHSNKEDVEYSDPVAFPAQFVERACQIGFDTMTVGKVMEEAYNLQYQSRMDQLALTHDDFSTILKRYFPES